MNNIDNLVYLLLVVIVIGIIALAIQRLSPSIPMDPRFRIVAVAIVSIILVLILFQYVVFPLLHHVT